MEASVYALYVLMGAVEGCLACSLYTSEFSWNWFHNVSLANVWRPRPAGRMNSIRQAFLTYAVRKELRSSM